MPTVPLALRTSCITTPAVPATSVALPPTTALSTSMPTAVIVKSPFAALMFVVAC